MALPGRNCTMESFGKAKKLIGRLLLWISLLLIGVAALQQHSSRFLQTLINHQDGRLQVAVFTQPAMQFTYNPAAKKAAAQVSAQNCSLNRKENCFNGQFDRFFVPAQQEQEAFWEGFQSALSSWRFNPLLTLKIAWTYITARHDKRTDLSLAEFFLLTQHLAALDITDFAIKYPEVQSKKKKSSKTPPPAEVSAEELVAADIDETRPLVVEILNASGRKGLASDLTQYLREQNNKGRLRVDVLQYDNYPSQQETSTIISYTGRLMQATQLSRAIGISSAIKSETSATAICDARIILGKDFQMPL